MAPIPEEFLQEFITEELSINHKLFPHEKSNGRYYKVREYRENAPKYLQELIDDIDDSKTFSELCGKRPQLAGLDEQLALAAGYSARTSISVFKEAMKRRIFVSLCRNERFHTKLFCDVPMKERFGFYEDLMAQEEDLIDLVSRCREYFGTGLVTEKMLIGYEAVDFESVLG